MIGATQSEVSMSQSKIVSQALAVTACAAWLLSACAPTGPELRTDYDRSTNFSAYRTYAYFDPVGTDKAGYSTLTTQHFKQAIDAQMAMRGYQKVESNPDLLVNFMANAVEKTDVRSTPSSSVMMGTGYYGYRGGMYATVPVYSQPDVQTVRYKVGTANVDIVDARAKKLLWTGMVEGELSDAVMKNPQPAIEKVIGEMFTQFPGHAGPAQ
jgi:Domain of unknown function (DUF4136)